MVAPSPQRFRETQCFFVGHLQVDFRANTGAFEAGRFQEELPQLHRCNSDLLNRQHHLLSWQTTIIALQQMGMQRKVASASATTQMVDLLKQCNQSSSSRRSW